MHVAHLLLGVGLQRDEAGLRQAKLAPMNGCWCGPLLPAEVQTRQLEVKLPPALLRNKVAQLALQSGTLGVPVRLRGQPTGRGGTGGFRFSFAIRKLLQRPAYAQRWSWGVRFSLAMNKLLLGEAAHHLASCCGLEDSSRKCLLLNMCKWCPFSHTASSFYETELVDLGWLADGRCLRSKAARW